MRWADEDNILKNMKRIMEAEKNMERLTLEKCGELLIKNNDREYRSPCFGCESINKCNPEKIACGFFMALKKLAEYEDLEEQGKLLKLPVAMGDRIYRIDTDEKIENREIEIYDIDNIVICSDGEILLKYDAYNGVICHLENITTDKPHLDYYRCFLTKESAEAAESICRLR